MPLNPGTPSALPKHVRPAALPCARRARRPYTSEHGKDSVADIRVEPRRRAGIWPWIAGLVVLALLIWGLTQVLGGGDDVVVEQSDPAAPTPAAP